MYKPFFVTESQAIDLVAYLYGYRTCPYCHVHWEKFPDAAEYSAHLLKCVHTLEKELEKNSEDL